MSGSNGTVAATAGQLFSGTLATLTDGNHNAATSDYTVMVDWGDGTPVTGAALTALGNGQFTVSGAHTWTTPGNYTATISVSDAGGDQ